MAGKALPSRRVCADHGAGHLAHYYRLTTDSYKYVYLCIRNAREETALFGVFGLWQFGS